jgi:YegS/Rv2252/BmrU family lipid kinase
MSITSSGYRLPSSAGGAADRPRHHRQDGAEPPGYVSVMVIPPDAPWLWAAPTAGLALLVFALVRGARTMAAGADPERGRPLTHDPEHRPRAAVVLNPIKFASPAEAKRAITEQCRAHGWADPLLLETTAADPGGGQTRQALTEEVDLVMACGGDGTVRAVAEELADTGMAFAILPTGTGNLLARNLGGPIDDFTAALRVALTGDDRSVDIGWLRADGGAARAFLVMAGVGFDAEIVDDAPERLKAAVGPVAYVVSGVRKLSGPRARVTVRVDDHHPLHRRVRTVLIGNCGRLQAGIELMPNARVDDGLLDLVMLAPEGIVGWAAVAGQVLTRRHVGHDRVEHLQGSTVSVHCINPLPAQLDGDSIGVVHDLEVSVGVGALRVRVPVADDPPKRLVDAVREASEALKARDPLGRLVAAGRP